MYPDGQCAVTRTRSVACHVLCVYLVCESLYPVLLIRIHPRLTVFRTVFRVYSRSILGADPEYVQYNMSVRTYSGVVKSYSLPGDTIYVAQLYLVCIHEYIPGVSNDRRAIHKSIVYRNGIVCMYRVSILRAPPKYMLTPTKYTCNILPNIPYTRVFRTR